MTSDTENRAGRGSVVVMGAVVVSLIVLAAHCRYYLPFLADDALISLRYAGRLLQGHGLTWTDGRSVEGYSNLLWVLLAAGMGRLGVDLVDGLRMLGFASAGLLVGAIAYAHRPTTLQQSLPMLVGLLTVVLAAPVAIWTVGGLEPVLVAGLLAWAVVLCYAVFEREDPPGRHLLAASVPLALLCITRPDGALFTAAIVLALLLARGLCGKTFRTGFLLASLPAVFYLGQLAFRLAYYGEWVPNTAYAKLSPSLQHLARGGVYVLEGFLSLSPLSVMAALTAGLLLLQRRDRSARAKAVLLVVLAVVWTAYVATIGGDTFPGWRHLVPLVALMALMLALGTQWVVQHGSIRMPAVFVPAILAGVFGLYGYLQFADERNHLAKTERWEWDGRVVGLMLKKGFGDGDSQPLLACTACGCLPYWSELPAVDMLGLNDYHIARHRPEGFGHGRPSHELGDGRYVLDRRPDLVILAGPRGREEGYFLSGVQMQQQPEFFELYSLVRFRGQEDYPADPVSTLIWVRRYSEKIGIGRSESKVTVPAYLLNGNRDTVAYLNERDKFVVTISPQQPAAIKNLLLPPGRWRVEVDSSTEVHVTVCQAGQGEAMFSATAPATFRQEKEKDLPVDVILQSPAGKRIEVRELTLVRAERTDNEHRVAAAAKLSCAKPLSATETNQTCGSVSLDRQLDRLGPNVGQRLLAAEADGAQADRAVAKRGRIDLQKAFFAEDLAQQAAVVQDGDLGRAGGVCRHPQRLARPDRRLWRDRDRNPPAMVGGSDPQDRPALGRNPPGLHRHHSQLVIAVGQPRGVAIERFAWAALGSSPAVDEQLEVIDRRAVGKGGRRFEVQRALDSRAGLDASDLHLRDVRPGTAERIAHDQQLIRTGDRLIEGFGQGASPGVMDVDHGGRKLHRQGIRFGRCATGPGRPMAEKLRQRRLVFAR